MLTLNILYLNLNAKYPKTQIKKIVYIYLVDYNINECISLILYS